MREWRLICLIFILVMIIPKIKINAQYLLNPSLEGTAGDQLPPPYWNTDDSWSDPDLRAVYITPLNNIVYTPVDGNIFLLFRTRGATYNQPNHAPRQREYLYQELEQPLERNTCFRFDIYLAFNSDYWVGDSEDPNVGYPIKFTLYGGNGPKSRDILLIESDPITIENWTQYTFYFHTDNNSYSYILMEGAWDTINVKPLPYNGMFLIDKLSLEKISANDTINEHTIYYQGDGETQLTAANGLSFTWTPNEFLFPQDSQLPLMLSYHDFFTVYIDRGKQCPSIELFNVILECDTLYADLRDRHKEYYYKYDTLAQLFASPGETWSWDPPLNLTAYDIQAPLMTDYHEEYSVAITDKYGCNFTDHFNILLHCDTLYPEPTILVLDTLVDQESSIQLVPRYGSYDGLWTPDRFLNCIDCQTPIASPRSTTTYRVELEDDFGCKHAEEFLINIEFWIPNVITPNDDGYNDCLKIFGLPENTAFSIYDKNGLLLFTIDPYANDYCWEGVDKNGDPLNAGTYWFALDHPVQGTLKKGFILIKR